MDKSCRTCAYFPCTKVNCTIGNKEPCNDYESTISKIPKEMEENNNGREDNFSRSRAKRRWKYW